MHALRAGLATGCSPVLAALCSQDMNEELVKTQMALLVQIVRCIQIKKILHELDPDPKLNFWRLIQGGFLDLPTLDWCKIFGSNAEPTHWKEIAQDQDNFREEMLNYLEISATDWVEYWNHMKNYRDELVAHYEMNSDVSSYPTLDIALKSSYFYYDYLANMLNEGILEEPMEVLENYSKRFYSSAKKVACLALEATSELKEVVY